MKKTKKVIEPVKSKFYKLDPSKPVAAEGCKSAFPFVFLFVAVFFCIILAFIVTVNKGDDTYDESEYKIFYILCGVFLGVALILFAAYQIRNARVRAKIRASTVTYATITTVIVEEYTTRDSDGDSHTKERVSLAYSFYDKSGSVRTERFNKTYGKAPDFYEGQQIVVAFDETNCYVLSQYTLLDEDTFEQAQPPQAENADGDILTGETISIKPDKYVPLGYDVRYYIIAGILLSLAFVFAVLLTYHAITVKDYFVWIYVGIFGTFCAVLSVMGIKTFAVPYRAKRRYDEINSYGATYTVGKLESTSKVYGNGSKTRYVCKYVDTNGQEHTFTVDATLSRKLVRYGDTEIIVAYANGKAVALVEKVPLSKLLR